MRLDDLLRVGFLTGSRAFGTERPDSDYDVVYAMDDTHHINAILEGLERTPSNYFSGYWVEVDGISINLIPVHPTDYLPWYLATECLKTTLALSGITDQTDKYAVFSGMVALFKATCNHADRGIPWVEQREQLRAITNFDQYAVENF